MGEIKYECVTVTGKLGAHRRGAYSSLQRGRFAFFSIKIHWSQDNCELYNTPLFYVPLGKRTFCQLNFDMLLINFCGQIHDV
jgi:hypothetical protein